MMGIVLGFADPHSSEGRESRFRLGLETEGTETLGLVSVS